MRTVAIALAAIIAAGLPEVSQAASCVTKAGSATGVTRDFAEYESLLIIRQVTGNWPIESDQIGKPSYKCKQDGAMWTCKAVAKVCKK